MSFLAKRRASGMITAAVLSFALVTDAVALPLNAASARDVEAQSLIIDIQYNRRAVRRGRGGNPGAAAVLGLFALGVGAVIANNQRQQEYYPTYGYPAYGYPEPVYPYPESGYVYQRAPV